MTTVLTMVCVGCGEPCEQDKFYYIDASANYHEGGGVWRKVVRNFSICHECAHVVFRSVVSSVEDKIKTWVCRNVDVHKGQAMRRAFVAEYLVDKNGTQAAIRAGYSPKSAHVQASRLLSNDKVKTDIAQAEAKRDVRTNMSQDFVIDRLRLEAMGDGQDTNAGARIRATELLGKIQNMFTDKVQVENVGPAPELRLVFNAPKPAAKDESEVEG